MLLRLLNKLVEHKVRFSLFFSFFRIILLLAIAKYDYLFAENGLVAYKNGKQFFEEVCSISNVFD